MSNKPRWVLPENLMRQDDVESLACENGSLRFPTAILVVPFLPGTVTIEIERLKSLLACYEMSESAIEAFLKEL